jgi:hypothetical protein
MLGMSRFAASFTCSKKAILVTLFETEFIIVSRTIAVSIHDHIQKNNLIKIHLLN